MSLNIHVLTDIPVVSSVERATVSTPLLNTIKLCQHYCSIEEHSPNTLAVCLSGDIVTAIYKGKKVKEVTCRLIKSGSVHA